MVVHWIHLEESSVETYPNRNHCKQRNLIEHRVYLNNAEHVEKFDDDDQNVEINC